MPDFTHYSYQIKSEGNQEEACYRNMQNYTGFRSENCVRSTSPSYISSLAAKAGYISRVLDQIRWNDTGFKQRVQVRPALHATNANNCLTGLKVYTRAMWEMRTCASLRKFPI